VKWWSGIDVGGCISGPSSPVGAGCSIPPLTCIRTDEVRNGQGTNSQLCDHAHALQLSIVLFMQA
jgi:hypothetical protein